MSSADEVANFFEKNYKLLCSWTLRPGKPEAIIGDMNTRRCRFCGLSRPAVTFRKKAHAIAESLGNKTLLTAFECDDCNQVFGQGIEADFGAWSKPMRLIARIRGKGGVPTIKAARAQGWRIEDGATGLNLSHDVMDPFVIIKEDENRMIFRLPRDPYTPSAVLKAFVKYGLSLIPDCEVENFRKTYEWIANPDHAQVFVPSYYVMAQANPGPPQNSQIFVMVLRRSSDYVRLPYTMMLIAYGVEIFQVFLPSCEKDWVTLLEFGFPYFQALDPVQTSKYGRPLRYRLDLSGTNIVRDDVHEIVMSFDKRINLA